MYVISVVRPEFYGTCADIHGPYPRFFGFIDSENTVELQKAALEVLIRNVLSN